MRGILVQSLTSRGVPFDVAFEVANKVREQLSEQQCVELSEVQRLVDELLPERYDLDVVPLQPIAVPSVTVSRGEGSPFSKGILANSLQGAGLDPTDAYDVARGLEAEFLHDGVREIDRVALRDRVAVTIERNHGAKAASRYRTLRAALESFGIDADRVVLGRVGENDCYVFGGRLPAKSGQEARRLPSLWVDIESYEVVRIDGRDGVRFQFGPSTDFGEGVRAPRWIGIEVPGQPPARLDVIRVAPANAPAAAFGTEWLTALPSPTP